MSFYNDASLVFLPSGGAGKDGKAYSIKPTDGSGDFTFSRGSNLTATRVDSNGLIEKGRENLLLQSNSFDTTWFLSDTSVTSGQSGYDGSNDAWLLNSTTTGSPRIQQIVSLSGVATYSVYAKAATDSFIQIRTFGANSEAWFNLSSGTIAAAYGSQYITSNIQSVGNGWYRCSVTFNGSLTTLRIYPASAFGVYSTSGNGVYIQDAQLEQGLVATEYIESGATKGKAGILEHSPRFDYSGGATCPSLLLEPQRTNLIEYSEYFEGSGWTAQAGITLTANTTETLSPEGLNNAYKVVSTDATKGFYFSGLSITNAAVRTIYLKGSVGGETIVFKDPSGFGTPSTKTLTTDWQRFEMATTNDGNTYQGLFIDDISVGTIYAYGAQLEEGSYPTSYIPNHSGGSVTRDADVNTLLNQSGVIGQTAGTILFDAYFDEAEKVNFSISDSSVSNFISIETTSSNEVTAKVEQGGSTQATITTSTSFFAEGDRLKCAIAYDDRDMAFYINGTQVNTAAPNLIPACDDVRFGNYDGSIKAKQRVNRVLLFDTRISNGNLATLTS